MGSIVIDPMPSVPSMTVAAQEFVEDIITDARQHTQDAVNAALATIDELKNVALPEALPEPPTPPTIKPVVTASLGTQFQTIPDFGGVTVQLPNEFVPDDIVIPDILSEIPEYMPLITGISVPTAPVYTPTAIPTAPAIETDFPMPDAPVADYGGVPQLAEINLPTFEPATLDPFDDAAPEFNVAAPNEAFSWSEPVYQEHLASRVQAALEELLAGGTGIPADVERAIWERDRERLLKDGRRQMAEARVGKSYDGWPMAPGALDGSIIAINRDVGDKIAGLSRDVSIKQADLEQKNRQFGIEQGIVFERLWIDMFLAAAQRAFDVVKLTMDMRIQVFNAQVAAFNVQQAVYAAKIERFKAQLQYVLSVIEAYKARLEAAQLQGEINKDLIAVFAAKIQAFQAQVEVYGALVKAVETKSELEKNKVDVYRTQVDAANALVGVQKSKFDAYVAQVQGETSKADLERANAQAYSARVGALSQVAEITLKEADAKIAVSQQKLQWNLANMQRIIGLAQMQVSALQGRVAAYEAETSRASAAFGAEAATKQTELQVAIENAKVLISYYEANIQVWSTRAQQIIELAKINEAGLEASGRITSTIAAGAAAGTSVAAGFQAGVSRGENSNQSESKSVSESTSTSTSTAQNTNININNDGFE